MATATERTKKRADATPLYAFVGMGDLAVEKIREVPDMISHNKIDIPTNPKAIRYRVTNTAADVRDKVGGTLRDLSNDPARFVRTQFHMLIDTVDELAGRGRKVVSRLRGKAAEGEREAKQLAHKAKHEAQDLKEDIKEGARDTADKAKSAANSTTTPSRGTRSTPKRPAR